MNFATFVICLILAAVVILDIRYLLKNGIGECGGSCTSCGTSCRFAGDIRRAKRRIRWEKKLRRLFGA